MAQQQDRPKSKRPTLPRDPESALSDAALDKVSGGTGIEHTATNTMRAGSDAQSGLASSLKAS